MRLTASLATATSRALARLDSENKRLSTIKYKRRALIRLQKQVFKKAETC